MTFERGSEPRLRTQKRPWGKDLCLGPTQKRRSSTFKGLPAECGALEFGGKALGEGVWVGFRPSTVGGGLRGGLRV